MSLALKRRSICALIASIAGSAPLFAESILLDEVIVTAQKRQESAQTVPISIAALSSSMLKAVGISDTDALAVVTPGLMMTRTVGSSTPFLRGIGTQNNNVGDEGAVATYVDGVFVGSSLSAVQSFNNIDRVEVLKGPQGTLFGRNATGGVIHIITKDPQHETSGSLSALYGNYETTGLNFYGTTGLNDNLAADFALYYHDQSDGYGTNHATGNDLLMSEDLSLRTKVLWNLSEKTLVKLTLDYRDGENSLGVARHPVEGALGINGALIYGGCLGAGGNAADCAGQAIAGAYKYTGDWNDAEVDIDPNVTNEQMGVSVKVEHSLQGLQFVSLSSYRETEEDSYLDVTDIPGSLQVVGIPSASETIVQEFQLISDTDSDLEWQAGLFYMKNDHYYDPYGFITGALLQGATFVLDNGQKIESYAVYGQGTYSFTEDTRFTLGLRYTKDKRDRYGELRTEAGGVVLPGTVADADASKNFDEVTWRLALDHNLNDHTMVFASYSRGFKSGVFGTFDVFDAVEPEILDAYEIGFKSDLADGLMRLNGSVFYYEYSDLQLPAIVGNVNRTINAADSEILGVELEWLMAATDSLDVYANLSYLDTEYVDFPDAVINLPTGIGGNATTNLDVSGNEMIRAPELTVNVGFNYRIALENAGQMILNLNYYYNDGFYWTPDNRARQPSYELVSAGISWLSPTEQHELRLSGNNLTDEEYGVYYAIGSGFESISPAAPLTYRLEYTYSF